MTRADACRMPFPQTFKGKYKYILVEEDASLPERVRQAMPSPPIKKAHQPPGQKKYEKFRISPQEKGNQRLGHTPACVLTGINIVTTIKSCNMNGMKRRGLQTMRSTELISVLLRVFVGIRRSKPLTTGRTMARKDGLLSV